MINFLNTCLAVCINKYAIYFILSLGLLFITQTFAIHATHNLKPAIYLFKNVGLFPILIDNVYHPGASAGFASYLNPKRWSVLMLNRGYFALHCINIAHGVITPLDCHKIVTTYRVPNPMTSQGNYWITENHIWLNAWIISIIRGVWLPFFAFERI